MHPVNHIKDTDASFFSVPCHFSAHESSLSELVATFSINYHLKVLLSKLSQKLNVNFAKLNRI